MKKLYYLLLFLFILGAQNTVKTEGSLSNLLKIYSKDKGSYIINVRLAWIYLSNKKYANARYHYQRAVETKPDSIEAMLGLVSTLVSMQDDETAQKYCHKILRKDKYNYYGNLYLIDILTRQELYDYALIRAKAILKFYPSDITLLYKVKTIYSFLKDEENTTRIQKIIDVLSI